MPTSDEAATSMLPARAVGAGDLVSMPDCGGKFHIVKSNHAPPVHAIGENYHRISVVTETPLVVDTMVARSWYVDAGEEIPVMLMTGALLAKMGREFLDDILCSRVHGDLTYS